MTNYRISVNQFAEFSSATDKGKERIIKQQITPNKLLIPWHHQAKASMKDYLTDVSDTSPLDEGIKKLRAKNPIKDWQKSDQKVSIDALSRIKSFNLHRVLDFSEYEPVRFNSKTIVVNNVEISLKPELVLRTKINNKIIYGGVKIHIGKSKPFSQNQCAIISALLNRYIKENVSDGTVLPEYCFSIDIFDERIVPASGVLSTSMSQVLAVCNEVKQVWDIIEGKSSAVA